MIDPAQTALFIVIIVLTVLLVILGIQVFFILRELRKTITKVNKVLDYTESITESVSKPKTGATIAKIFQGDKKHKKDE